MNTNELAIGFPRSSNDPVMSQLFRFSDAVERAPSIELWMRWQKGDLGKIARHWFEVMRECGGDVREVLHDGHPTACVGDAAFAYVDTFKAHVNVGFFFGAQIADPQKLLEGGGKCMRHVKVRPGVALDAEALSKLIGVAYADIKHRMRQEKHAVSEPTGAGAPTRSLRPKIHPRPPSIP